MRQGRAAEAGFTLLELLVGLTVFGFILAGLAGGVRYGVRATDSQARLVERNSELDAVDRLLRRLLASADPGSTRGGPAMSGTAGQLAFVSVLPGGLSGVVDEQADIVLGVDAARRLVLRWTPHRHGRPLSPPAAATQAEVLRGIERLELGYWNNGWRARWDEPALPALVRVRIVFPAGDARHWPDIVVAPVRGRIQ